MGLFWGKPQDTKEYYREEADKLKRESERVLLETGDKIEASRLSRVAAESSKNAQRIDRQLDKIAENIK
jgi:hypothetical protein